MQNMAYVNGAWGDLSSASVSVEDRGFQFGDGVYELIRTYHGTIFHLQEHIRRLYKSLEKIEISINETPSQLERIVQTGVEKSGYKETKIYIQVTRGAAPRLHAFPKSVRPTLVMTFRELDKLSPKVNKGVEIISVEDIRWGWCNVKSLNLLPNLLARERAVKSGAFEAIFVRGRFVWEGTGSNLFAVFGKKVVTPPIGPYLLSGITREVVLALGKKMGLKMVEAKITLDALYRADEIFLTGTTVEVLSVLRLNKKPIGTGRSGTMTSLLQQAFQNAVSS